MLVLPDVMQLVHEQASDHRSIGEHDVAVGDRGAAEQVQGPNEPADTTIEQHHSVIHVRTLERQEPEEKPENGVRRRPRVGEEAKKGHSGPRVSSAP
jgi:hypothetical protein